jgi:hypothetical protein
LPYKKIIRPKYDTIWTNALQYYTHYLETELVDVIQLVRNIHWDYESSPYQASGKKYHDADKHFASQSVAIRPKELRYDFEIVPIINLNKLTPNIHTMNYNSTYSSSSNNNNNNKKTLKTKIF